MMYVLDLWFTKNQKKWRESPPRSKFINQNSHCKRLERLTDHPIWAKLTPFFLKHLKKHVKKPLFDA